MVAASRPSSNETTNALGSLALLDTGTGDLKSDLVRGALCETGEAGVRVKIWQPKLLEPHKSICPTVAERDNRLVAEICLRGGDIELREGTRNARVPLQRPRATL